MFHNRRFAEMQIHSLPLGEGRVRVPRFAKTCDPHPALRADLSQRERDRFSIFHSSPAVVFAAEVWFGVR